MIEQLPDYETMRDFKEELEHTTDDWLTPFIWMYNRDYKLIEGFLAWLDSQKKEPLPAR